MTKISDCVVEIISQEKNEGCKVKIRIKVDPSFAAKEYDRAIEKLSKTVSLPGFRKGKVPQSYVVEKLRDRVEHSWREEVAQKASQKVIRDLNLQIIPPAFYHWESEQSNDSEDLILVLVVEQYPEVPNISAKDLKDLETRSFVGISDDDVEKKMLFYATQIADWSSCPDYPIDESCRVSLEIIDSNNNIVNSYHKKSLTLINESEHILGMKIGDIKEISIPAGKCSIKVNDIERKIPVALDDEFSKKFGKNSINELRAEVKNNLTEIAKADFVENSKDDIQRALADLLSFDLPRSLVDQEIDARKAELVKLNKSLSDDDLAKLIQDSESALRAFFAIESIANKNNISLSDSQKSFIFSQSPPGAAGDNVRKHMAAKIITHEVFLFLMKELGWI